MFVPNHLHTKYSLMDSDIRADKLAKKCVEYEYPACTITDHGNIAGVVEFSNALLKEGIKPINGIELYVSSLDATIKSDLNKKLLHMVCLAKNKQGFYDLCKIVSRSNDDDVFYYKPRLDLNKLGELKTNNLLWFTGHPGSILFDAIMNEGKIHSDSIPNSVRMINRMIDLFGKENLFIEVQRVCYHNSEYSDILTEISQRTGVKTIACIDAHYVDKADVKNQRLLLASSLGTNLVRWKQDLAHSGMSSFFLQDHYHIPSYKELKAVHTEEELKNNLLINDMCESYSLKNKPSLPRFECPNGMTEELYLKDLCRQGWRNILQKRNVVDDKFKQNQYAERVLTELDVISEYDLSGYFLIVQDVIKWARDQTFLNTGRGSAAGSLVSYLLGITLVDPIPYNLLFTRFLNRGRFTKDHFEYPDIDMDFPGDFREKAIDYVKEKYGKNRVGKVATFGTLHGAGAIKEVLRMHQAVSPTEMDQITKYIPQEADVSDHMSSQEEKSIIRYTLRNMPSVLEEYCTIDDKDVLHGKLASYFQQSIEIEGAVKSQGVHAAGLIISANDLNESCPMVRSKDGEKMCGIEMDGLKDMGFIKFDFLSVNSYSKLNRVNELLRGSNV